MAVDDEGPELDLAAHGPVAYDYEAAAAYLASRDVSLEEVVDGMVLDARRMQVRHDQTMARVEQIMADLGIPLHGSGEFDPDPDGDFLRP